MKKNVLAAAAVLAVILWVAWVFPRHETEGAQNGKAPGPKSEPATGESGNAVAVGSAAQAASGIATATLKTVIYRENVKAYGVVLRPDALLAARNDYVSAMAALDRADAALAASSSEYERLKALNDDDKNVSDRRLQTAQAVLGADRAAALQARQGVRSARQAVALRWGGELAGWIFDASAGFRRLINLQDVLVQVTVPPGESVKPIPGEIRIEDAEGKPVRARFIARAPGTDPRIQGMSFVYLAPARANRLLPGMNVAAGLPSGPGRKGAVLPLSAVVWSQGKAWAYVRRNETEFERVEVPVSRPVSGGYFVAKGHLPDGARIAVRGAQALLSEESRSQRKGGGGGDEGD